MLSSLRMTLSVSATLVVDNKKAPDGLPERPPARVLALQRGMLTGRPIMGPVQEGNNRHFYSLFLETPCFL